MPIPSSAFIQRLRRNFITCLLPAALITSLLFGLKPRALAGDEPPAKIHGIAVISDRDAELSDAIPAADIKEARDKADQVIVFTGIVTRIKLNADGSATRIEFAKEGGAAILAYVTIDNLANLPGLNLLTSKNVAIRGEVHVISGQPKVEVTEASQIKIISSGDESPSPSNSVVERKPDRTAVAPVIEKKSLPTLSIATEVTLPKLLGKPLSAYRTALGKPIASSWESDMNGTLYTFRRPSLNLLLWVIRGGKYYVQVEFKHGYKPTMEQALRTLGFSVNGITTREDGYIPSSGARCSKIIGLPDLPGTTHKVSWTPAAKSDTAKISFDGNQ